MSVRARLRESVSHVHLDETERARAEVIFAAILSAETAGLPAFETTDRETFWRILEEAPAPSFGPGLRVMVHALTLLPLARPRYRARFHMLDREAQRAFLAELEQDERYPLRQLVTTMKMLALFAYFDDERVRARFDLTPEANR
jgi:hypothetical protein